MTTCAETAPAEIKSPAVTRDVARKVRDVVRCGLVCGMGEPEPGKMCVEAAVCYALGLPHSDNPPCVAPAVRSFKIALNDSPWPDDAARAKGLERVAIAQLGSKALDSDEFFTALVRRVIARVLSPLLHSVAAELGESLRPAVLQAASDCAANPGIDSAKAAYNAMDTACPDARCYYTESLKTAERAYHSAQMLFALLAYPEFDDGDYEFRSYRIAHAVRQACDAINSHEPLCTAAECAVEALKECGSPGCDWLDVLDEPAATAA